MSPFDLTALAVLAFLLLRNWLSWRMHLRAITICFAQDNWKQLDDLREDKGQIKQMLDLTVWTFDQFSPFLIEYKEAKK